MTFSSEAFPDTRYGFWKPPHSLITLSWTLTSLLLSWSFSYKERSTEQGHSAQDQEGGGWVPIPRGPWRMARLGTAFCRGKKKKLEGLGQSRWGTKLWETESVCKIPLGLSLDKGCSLGDTRVPQEPHTAQEGQSPQVTPNRRHSLLSGVSISPKQSRTPESIP